MNIRKFKLYQEFSAEEIDHYLLPRPEVVDSYVVEMDIGGKKVITDFISFYTLPSSVLKHEKIKEMKVFI